MSEDAPSNRKEKKALRDAERQKQRQSKKRKLDETEEVTEQGGHEDAELKKDFIPLEATDGGASEAAPAVKAPKSKKRKLKEQDAAEIEPAEAAVDGTAPKPKKRKQREDDAAEVAPVEAAVDGTAPKPKKRRKSKKATQDVGATAVEGVDTPEGTATSKPRGDRFVVFIGNLPYNTTDASVQAHFQKLMPFTLRHRTDPKTKKSKGFAFIEFENYDRMKTCLKLYHHSMFDPADYPSQGTGPAVKGQGKGARKINVELTAGGGGKKEGRMEKIKVKNVRLEEQRARRLEQELKESARSDRKGGNAKKQAGAKQEGMQDGAAEGDSVGMHPSRLAMIKR
ncbi:hypothetical protein LTR85_008883 [Meristemomyces frigidus]|nr:hypothetical protein LTR85_008883 [Meristemomyces frigidus]